MTEEEPLDPLDYLIDQSGIDWHTCLKGWQHLLPSTFTIWLVNRFGDLFISYPDESIHHLDIQLGVITKRGENKKEFLENLLDGTNANEWLYMNYVDQAQNFAMLLKPGECYTFKIPPVLSGEFELENLTIAPVGDVLPFLSTVHAQIKDLPEGAAVNLTFPEED